MLQSVVPALARDKQERRLGLASGHRQGLLEDDRLDRLSLPIVGVEKARERLGLGEVRGRKKLRPEAAAADAATGVDAGPQNETQVIRREGSAGAGNVRECCKPGPGRRRDPWDGLRVQ